MNIVTAAPWNVLPVIARAAIASHLAGTRWEAPELDPPLRAPQGIFVTLWSPGHQLRGCIGHISPVGDTLAEEVAVCAVSAATQDPRFPPVQAAELDRLELEISVLHPPEPVNELSDLDPETYGVVVTAGGRRGVLLAGVDGVQDVAHQIDIARRKAGIGPTEAFTLQRFAMTKIPEPPRD